MKNRLTGKQINEWAKNVRGLPEYWGETYEWKDKGTNKKVRVNLLQRNTRQ